ncbi:MAG: hypothetical protein ACOX7G_04305 [Candidatus Scatomorpha sp.]
MRRMIPLILALMLLAACAAEATPEGSAVPTPVPTPASTPPEQAALDLPRYYTEPRPVPEELDFPDDGFEAEEYYLAEPFGICGRALLLRDRDAAGRERFKCRYFSYVPEGGEYVLRGSSADESSGAYIQEQSGALLASVPYLSEGVPGPEVFYPVDRETALRAWRDMPFFDEIALPLDRWITEARLEGLPGVSKLGEHEYEYEGVRISCREFSTRNAAYIHSFYSESPGAPLSVRGLSIGESTLSEALERFPCQLEDYTPGLMGGPLYGTWDDGLYGEPRMSDQGSLFLQFQGDESFLRLSFDENEVLSSIFWSTSEYDDVTYMEET